MARKDVKKEYDYHGRGEMSITAQWYYMDLLKAPRFPYQKRIHNKGHLNLATEVLKGFNPGVFNSLCVTHNKNLEQWERERANNISLIKSNSTAVNSNSKRES